MTIVHALPLDDTWKRRFDLADREAPEYYEKADAVRNTPHASAIRATLEDLGASAVFCVQGVPTIVLLRVEDYDRTPIMSLHAALWNQGLASMLLVISDNVVRAFSLVRTPFDNPGDEFDRRCLIETLDAVADGLELKNIVYGAESGRYWEEHAAYFKPKERVDHVLLENLTSSHELLVKAHLSPDAAQALLIQAMFIAYLEDREITGPGYFRTATDGKAETFSALLETGNAALLKKLFGSLRKDFNGDLFVAPCSFESNASPPPISRTHLEVLSRFRSGREVMAQSGQLQFWGYNFKHIPIELISAVYDRFLGEREAERREQGAYYTPMFLADTVVSQVWDAMPAASKEKSDFLDPACGSGVFLVRCFQRLCEHWRETRTSRTIRWDSLLSILSRLNGWDVNGSAVRVAVFSLYIALLEQVSPPDILLLIKRGKVLPDLWGKTLRRQDFFAVDQHAQFDVVLGNPPWTSRRGPTRSSATWCAKERLPMPGREDAWAFTWKALRHLKPEGVVAFLLPAMGFLHNHADISIQARNRLLATARVRRIVNFADLRFQLFDGAIRPAALIIFGAPATDKRAYQFEYWAPKADLNLRVKRSIALSSADKSFITSKDATEDSLIFKRRLWMSEPDAKLFNYLAHLPKIGDLVGEYGNLRRTGQLSSSEWIIGQGFKPANPERLSDRDYDSEHSAIVAKTPYLSIGDFAPLAIGNKNRRPWKNGRVHRKGFEPGFHGPRVLIPRGVSVASMRLRAAFVEDALTFQDIIQAIVLPQLELPRGKLLAALLNSKVAIWYAFHGTASFGSDRPEVKQAELMRLPFPSVADLPEPERAKKASKMLVSIIDRALVKTSEGFALQQDPSKVFGDLDQLAYDYFCLSPEEIILVEDAVRWIFPAVQPQQNTFPDVWKTADSTDRHAYAGSMVTALGKWFGGDQHVNVRLEAHNADLGLLKLTLTKRGSAEPYSEMHSSAVREALARIFSKMHQRLPGNFLLMPDLRVFDGNNLYLVKPMQRRFWLRSAALADAGAIALDLQDFIGTERKRGKA